MTTAYVPRPGSRTERAAAALAASPMSALALSDLLDCDQKQVPGILAAAIEHGLVTVDRVAKPFMYCLASTPPPSGTVAAPPPSTTAAAASASATASGRPLPAPPAARRPSVTRKARTASTRETGETKPAPAAVAAASTRLPRFGLFSDNSLQLELADQTLTLDADTTVSLVRFLDSHALFLL